MLRILLLLFVFASSVQGEDELASFFENRIRPVLSKYCYDCHSVDGGEASGGLLLDSRDGWQRGGDSGEAIVPGRPEASRLIEAISYQNLDLQMPPEGQLPRSVVADIRTWIQDGAFDPRAGRPLGQRESFDVQKLAADHWAWQPRRSFDDRHSIDDFIAARLAPHGLTRAPSASPAVLMRRLSFDLVGLPPSPGELHGFELACDTNRERAIEDLVDRLLNSPRFGEKWASHWLDVVDFSETKGHVTDQERPYAWKYRDYVIDALNDDVPYDRFVVEHVAGDLLPPELHRSGRQGQTNVTSTATGVLYMHEMHFMAVDPVQQRWDEIDAQIDLVGKAFLGITLECARCHDHKFDAVSQHDYYALAGFFYSTEQATHRTAPRQSPGNHEAELKELEADYQDFLEQKRQGRIKAQTPKTKSVAYFPVSEELGIQSPGDTANLFKRMRGLEQLDPSWGQWVRSAVDVRGWDVPVMIRGEASNPGPTVVRRRFLEAINPSEPSVVSGSGRLWLADQIVAPENPLTARVYANRVWQHLFGRGIVATPNDFGKLGTPPTHPELLDFLAHRLVANGWSTKALIREIVLSATYQQSSHGAQHRTGAETDNKLFSHQNRRRLTAEQIRDAMLSVSGTIDLTMYGPGVDPFVPPFATANKASNVPRSGPLDGANRRSVYIKVRRNFLDPFLRTFDYPERGKPVGRRDVTIAPQQALAMLNNPLVHELASDWGTATAESATNETAPNHHETVRQLWLSALGRSPTSSELGTVLDLLSDSGNQGDEEVTWKDVAHLVFNHPDFLWID